MTIERIEKEGTVCKLGRTDSQRGKEQWKRYGRSDWREGVMDMRGKSDEQTRKDEQRPTNLGQERLPEGNFDHMQTNQRAEKGCDIEQNNTNFCISRSPTMCCTHCLTINRGQEYRSVSSSRSSLSDLLDDLLGLLQDLLQNLLDKLALALAIL
jgi:hypothetical protein